MIGASLYSLLTAHAPLIALVGSKIYPVQAKQGEKDPMVVYGITKQRAEPTKAAASIEDYVMMEVVVYAKDYDLMHQISKEVRNALDKKSGTIAGNIISEINFEDFSDGWEQERESYAGVSMYLIISTP
jgi:hypothetical protein